MVQENTVIENENPAIIRLKTVERDIEIEDMGTKFKYQRIFKPDGVSSDLFNVFYKDTRMDYWLVSNGCLNEDFSFIKTSEVVKQIKESLGSILINEKHYRYGTAIKSSFILNDYELQIPEDDEVDKIIFKLVTNIDADVSTLSKCGITFNIINGYSGNKRLLLNYGFLKNITARINDKDKVLSSNNIFLLDQYKHSFIHDQIITISFEEVVNVKNAVQGKITLFKSLSINDAFIDAFTDNFPTKFVKKFLSLYESLPSGFKNMYYVSFIWAVLLDSEKKIDLEIKLRNFVNEFIP